MRLEAILLALRMRCISIELLTNKINKTHLRKRKDISNKLAQNYKIPGTKTSFLAFDCAISVNIAIVRRILVL